MVRSGVGLVVVTVCLVERRLVRFGPRSVHGASLFAGFGHALVVVIVVVG